MTGWRYPRRPGFPLRRNRLRMASIQPKRRRAPGVNFVPGIPRERSRQQPVPSLEYCVVPALQTGALRAIPSRLSAARGLRTK